MAPMAPANARWGDDPDSSDDESEAGVAAAPSLTTVPETSGEESSSGLAVKIPPTHTSRVDAKGVKVVTSFRADPANPSRLVKTTTKIRVTHEKVRENVAVATRRKWKKFGQAAVDEDQSNVTIQSRDDVFMEDPNADVDLQEEDAGKALSGNLNAFWAKQNMRNLQRKYDVDGDDAGKPEGGGEDGWTQVGAGGGGGNKYIPPSARGGAAGSAMGGKSLSALAAVAGPEGDRRNDNRDQNTIRVTNISEDTTEDDLRDLFRRFGHTTRIYLAKDRQTHVSRGFAFISYADRDSAQKAVDKLDGYGYDNLILHVEFAKPREENPDKPSAGSVGAGRAGWTMQGTR